MTIGILHPGEMGAAIGAALTAAGREVGWASEGRSPASAERARSAGLRDAGSLTALVEASDAIVSVCPPHAALAVAAQVAEAAGGKTGWLYLDANAIAPATAARVAETVSAAGARYVDGGIIGPAPVRAGTTRLYLSGRDALELSDMLSSGKLELHCLGDERFAASALKLCYAAWTKGSAALLLSAMEAAGRSGLGEVLEQEWRTSLPDLIDRHQAARRSADTKGWRWSGEMDEIAAMMQSLGLPSGFHRAAAEVFRSGG